MVQKLCQSTPKFTTVFIVRVYIFPSANVRKGRMHTLMFGLLSLEIPTMLILNWCLWNFINTCTLEPQPYCGYSVISFMLIPAYRLLVRCSKTVLKQVRTRPAGAISAHQKHFEHTDWHMLGEAATSADNTNLKGHTSSVTSYISRCIDDVTVSKTIISRSNQKL